MYKFQRKKKILQRTIPLDCPKSAGKKVTYFTAISAVEQKTETPRILVIITRLTLNIFLSYNYRLQLTQLLQDFFYFRCKPKP